jgi:ATP-binding cassette subfamily C (CFTR/MRP) protein 1
MDRCYERLNASQKPFYLLLMVQQWLAFVLDTLSAILAVLVVILAIKVLDSLESAWLTLSRLTLR